MKVSIPSTSFLWTPKRVTFPASLMDDSGEIKFNVWTEKDLPKISYNGKYLHIPCATFNNGFIKNKMDTEFVILDEMLNELC